MMIGLYVGDDSTPAITFPMLPEKIQAKTATRFRSFDIMNVGEIKIPQGEELTAFSWSGTLPGKRRWHRSYITGDKEKNVYMEPLEIQSLLSQYRINGTKLRIIVDGTPIDHYVYLESFEAVYIGGSGDYEYSVAFIVAKDLQILLETNISSQAPSIPRPQPTPAVTYVVKKGDTLWDIARKYTGDGIRWREIYQSNKELIDARNAKASQTARDQTWVWPGQVLIMPW